MAINTTVSTKVTSWTKTADFNQFTTGAFTQHNLSGAAAP
jgi:hypothetical protein